MLEMIKTAQSSWLVSKVLLIIQWGDADSILKIKSFPTAELEYYIWNDR